MSVQKYAEGVTLHTLEVVVGAETEVLCLGELRQERTDSLGVSTNRKPVRQ